MLKLTLSIYYERPKCMRVTDTSKPNPGNDQAATPSIPGGKEKLSVRRVLEKRVGTAGGGKGSATLHETSGRVYITHASSRCHTANTCYVAALRRQQIRTSFKHRLTQPSHRPTAALASRILESRTSQSGRPNKYGVVFKEG